MIELLCHLVGDYVLQFHKMALRKTSSWTWAALHAAVYVLPFLVLTSNPIALGVIAGTHAVIDRLGLAGRWCRWYGVGHPGLFHRPADGEFQMPPPFLGVWLTIIVDNTFHLVINCLTLKYLA